MAKLSREDVLKLAQLSRLELTDDEVAEFQEEISQILSYVEQLQQVDVDGLDPTYQVTNLTNVMRIDTVADYGYKPETLLQNVPELEKGHIKTKRIL